MPIAKSNDGIILSVKATPRAAKTALAGAGSGFLRVRINAPPVENAANDELRRFLASVLGVRSSAVTIISGATSTLKRIEIVGIGPDEARRKLGLANEGGDKPAAETSTQSAKSRHRK